MPRLSFRQCASSPAFSKHGAPRNLTGTKPSPDECLSVRRGKTIRGSVSIHQLPREFHKATNKSGIDNTDAFIPYQLPTELRESAENGAAGKL